MVGLAQLDAILHDAGCIAVEDDAVFSDSDLVNDGGFGE